MKKNDIERKFDEIVAFSEIEKFLDTPVKRYSSGMYVRLAFAVAAHMEPEILLVDEVLAVGDAEFQKKCLGKMSNVAGEGRTVLFVSHNMGAIQMLCPNSLLIRNGELVSSGPSAKIVSEYLNIFSSHDNEQFNPENPARSGNKSIILTGGRIIDYTGSSTTSVVAGQPIVFEFDYQNKCGAKNTGISLTIFDSFGIAITNVDTSFTLGEIRNLGKKGHFRCVINRNPFPLGDYRVAIAIQNSEAIADHIPNALSFTVDSSVFFPTSRTPDKKYCAAMVDHHWEHSRFDE